MDHTDDHLHRNFYYNPNTGDIYWKTNCLRNSKRIDAIAGTLNPGQHRVVRLNGKNYQSHRLAWFLHYREWPDREIDHINGIRNDNRISNLRLATRSQNAMNSRLRKTNKSGFKGVSFHEMTGKWMARIYANKKYYYLGLFNSAQDAHAAYVAALPIHHGEFARAA